MTDRIPIVWDDDLPDTIPLSVKSTRTKLEETLAPAQHAASGFLQATGASPAAIEDNPLAAAVPNMVWAVGTLAESALNYFDIETDVGKRMGEYFASGVQNARAVASAGPLPDIGEPQGFIEQAAESTGDLFLTTGTALTKLPKMIQPMAAILAPGMQATTAGGRVLEAGASVVAGELLRDHFDPEYVGLIDQVTTAPEEIRTHGSVEEYTQEELKEQQQLVSMASVALMGGALMSAAVGSVRAGMRASQKGKSDLMGTVDANKYPQEQQPAETNFGYESAAATTRGDAFQQYAVNVNAPVENPLLRMAQDDHNQFAQRARDMWVSMGNPQTMHRRIRDSSITGYLPGSDTRMTHTFQQMGTQFAQLTPDQLAKLNDALLAGTRMDDMLKKQTNVWGNSTSGYKTYQQLQNILNGMDTATQRVYDNYLGFMDEMAAWMADGDHAVITQSRLGEWRSDNSRYAPVRLHIVKKGLGGGTVSEQSITDHLVARTGDLADSDAAGPGQLMPPVELLGDYMEAAFRSKEFNRLRTTTIDLLENYKRRDGTPVFERAKTGQQGFGYVTIYRHGKPETWKINDTHMAHAMQLAPSGLSRTFTFINDLRRLRQQFTTGIAKPGFAPVSAMFEATAGAVLGGGNVRERLMTLAGPVSGTVQHAADTALEVGQAVSYRFLNREGGMLRSIVGDEHLQRIHSSMHEAYTKTLKSRYERQGGGSAIVYSHDPNDPVPSLLLEVSPDYIRKHGTGVMNQIKSFMPARAFLMGLDSIHSGVRLEAFSQRSYTAMMGKVEVAGQEYPLMWFEDPDLVGAAHALELTGNPSKRGDGKWTRRLTAMIPYSNIAVQAMSRTARAFRDDPVGTGNAIVGTTVGILGSLAYQFANDPAAAYHYWNVMTDDERAQGMPIYSEGKMQAMIQYGHETRLWISPMLEGLKAWGLDSGDADVVQEMHSALWQTFFRDIVPGYPVGVEGLGNVGMRYAGIDEQMPQFRSGSFESFNRRSNREDVRLDKGTITYVEDIVQDLLGGIGTDMVEFWDYLEPATVGKDGERQAPELDAIQNAFESAQMPNATRPLGALFPGPTLEARVRMTDDISQKYHDGFENATELSKKWYPQLRYGLMGRQAIRPDYDPTVPLPPFTPREQVIIAHAKALLDTPAFSAPTGPGQRRAGMMRQLSSIARDTTLDMRTRVRMENEIRMDIRAMNSQLAEVIEAMEAAVAHRLAQPDIGLDEPDFTFADPGMTLR